MRKLVRLASNGGLTEVDQKALRREALALKEYMEHAPKNEEDIFRYREKVLPLVEAALDGTLEIPYKGQSPYLWRLMLDGLAPMLPQRFSSELYSPFMNRISGSALCSDVSYQKHHDMSEYRPEILEMDGVQYQWVEFED